MQNEASQFSNELWAALNQMMRPGAVGLIFAKPGSPIEQELTNAGFEVTRLDTDNVDVRGKKWSESRPWQLYVQHGKFVIRPADGGYTIAEVFDQKGSEKMPHYNVYSHALLIQGAPELYEACELTLEVIRESTLEEHKKLVPLLEAALERAGRQS